MSSPVDGTVEQIDGNHVIRFERLLDKPLERVWAAIATPEGIGGWLGDAQIEPREGARVRLRFDKTVGNVIYGRVTRADPPTVLEYTFHEHEHPDPAVPQSRVRWELSEVPGGGTRLVLTHTLPSPEDASKALAGWHTLLDMMPAAIDGADPVWSQERWAEVEREYAAAIG